MNDSIHRVGLAFATLAVVVTVGGAFAVDGYRSAQAAAASSPAPVVVYVRAPQGVQLAQTAPAAPAQVIHVVMPDTGHDTDGGGD